MHTTAFTAFLVTAAFAACSASPSPSKFNASSWSSKDVLYADVVVLGGGSAGTYAAFAVKDAGHSVLVVEKSGRLGGHFDTYTDPSTNIPVDYGVQLVWNTSLTRAFFQRFNFPLANFQPPPVPTVLADFTTGQNVSGVQTSSTFGPYAAQVEQYPYLDYGVNFTNPPPADFSLSFGNFVTKYGLQDEAYAIYNSPACSGLGNFLNQTTLSVFRCLNDVSFSEGEGNAVVPANGNWSSLYATAQAQLGSSVLLSSTVIATQRPRSNGIGAAMIVQTPAGQKLVITQQILVAFPQISSNMQPLGLDAKETPVFSNIVSDSWITGLVKNTGLSLAYYLNAGAQTLYNIPNLPGFYHIAPTAAPGVYNFWYGSDTPVSQSQVQTALFSAINDLTGKPQQPQIVAYSDHSPYNLHFDAAHTAAGYYSQFNALQGYRNTWYTGAIQTLPSGAIWAATQTIVQQIVAKLA